MLQNAKVMLAPPTNITFFLIESTEAVIAWAPPQVYHTYDVNTSLIDPPVNESSAWLNRTNSRTEDGNNSSESINVATPSTDAGKLITDNVTTQDNASATIPRRITSVTETICDSLEFFANFTVDFNRTEQALNSSFPQLIQLKDMYLETNTTADVDTHKMVPFSQGCVVQYQLFYFPSNQSDNRTVMKVVNATDTPEVHLFNLSAGTNYTVYIVALFVANRTMQSENAFFTTLTQAQPPSCKCEIHGVETSDGVPGSCNASLTQPCVCKNEYEGQFCERCRPGFYRTAPYFPCHRCPCDSHSASESSCFFREGFLMCHQCQVGYAGTICHNCDYGYYRHRKYCVPCNCNGNHNRTVTDMCNQITGSCNCMYNASGFNCEQCAVGYEGIAIHYQNCTKEFFNVFKVLPQSVIAGLCVGIILFLSFTVGCIIYVRMSKNPPKRPFWTVELKNDHEGVNFNSVPNDEFQIVDPKMNMEDQDFYENQGGAAQSHGVGTGGKKYARLNEQA